jgi:hypothetical protein
MLNNITWQGYWTTIALLSTGYYVVIYLLYFRNDLKISLAKGEKRKWTASGESSPLQPTLVDSSLQTTGLALESASEIDHLADACADELSAYFQEASRSRGSKEEMLFALSKLLSKYPALRSSEYAASLSNLIQSEAAHHCSLHLSREDVSKVWLG